MRAGWVQRAGWDSVIFAKPSSFSRWQLALLNCCYEWWKANRKRCFHCIDRLRNHANLNFTIFKMNLWIDVIVDFQEVSARLSSFFASNDSSEPRITFWLWINGNIFDEVGNICEIMLICICGQDGTAVSHPARRSWWENFSFSYSIFVATLGLVSQQ